MGGWWRQGKHRSLARAATTHRTLGMAMAAAWNQIVLCFEYSDSESPGIRLPTSVPVVHFTAWTPAGPPSTMLFLFVYIFVDLILTKSTMKRTFNSTNFKGTKLDQRAQTQEFAALK